MLFSEMGRCTGFRRLTPLNAESALHWLEKRGKWDARPINEESRRGIIIPEKRRREMQTKWCHHSHPAEPPPENRHAGGFRVNVQEIFKSGTHRVEY